MDETGASKSAIKRDLDYMRYSMDAPIQYDRTRNGYYYDPASANFEMPGLWFNAGELQALLACEQLLESIQPGVLKPYLKPLKARFHRLLGKTGHSVRAVRSKVRLTPIARRNPDTRQFSVVAGAFRGWNVR